jgi:hypothetical protein
MNEEELAKLVVRLVGDPSKLIDALKQTQQATTATATHVQAEAKKMEGAFHGVHHVAETTLRLFETLGVVAGFKEALEKFEEFERANIRLEAVLNANDRNVTETMEEYNRFARVTADTTTASKGQVKALLELAETYGLTGKAAEQAASEAMGVAAVTGKDAETLMRVSQAMAKGGDLQSIQHFLRFIPQLRDARNEAELLEKWERLVAAGGDVMAKQLDTASGQLDKAKQRMGAFGKEVGGAVATGIQPLTKALGEAAEWFSHLDPATRQSVSSFVALLAATVAFNNVAPILGGQLMSLAKNPFFWVAAAVVAVSLLKNEVGYTTDELNKMNEALARSKAGWDQNVAIIHELASTRMEQIGTSDDPVERLGELREEQARLTKEMEASQRQFDKMKEHGPNMVTRWFAGPETKQQMQDIEGVGQEVNAYAQALARVAAAIARLQAMPKERGSIVDFLTAQFKHFTDVTSKEFVRAADEFENKQAEAIGAMIDNTRTPMEKFQEGLQQLDNWMYEGLISQDLYDRGLKHLQDQLNKTADAQKNLNGDVEAAGYGTTRAAQALAGSLAAAGRVGGAVQTGMPVDQALAGGVRGGGNFIGAFAGEARGQPPAGAGWRIEGVGEARGGGRNTGPEFGGDPRDLGKKLDTIAELLRNMTGIRLGNARIGG